MSSGRYSSFEDPRHDVQFAGLERRMRNLETESGAIGSGLNTRVIRVINLGSITSGAYIDVPGSSFTFTKRSSATELSARIDASGFASGGLVKASFAVSVAGTGGTTYVDYPVSDFLFNNTGVHAHWGYDVDGLIGVPAGPVDVIARVKVDANTFTSDINDIITLRITEIESY